MDNKGDRPSRIPAGTFGPSVPPPPPPEAIAASVRPAVTAAAAEERRRFTSTLVDGAGAVSRASVPPPLPEDATRRRSLSTLVGHTPGAVSPSPSAAPVLSPPKWQGAKAYLEGREPKPRVSSIPNLPAVSAAAAAHASAMPSKVTTKLGSPPARAESAQLADASSPASDSPLRRELEAHLTQPLALEAASIDALDDIPVEELSSDEVTELRASDPGAAPVSAPSAPVAVEPPVVLPLLVQAPAARTHGASPEPERFEPVAVLERGPRPAAVVPLRPSVPAATAARAATMPAAISSLAPAESAARTEPSQRTGAVLLAAIVLLSAGGWALTRGGFQRRSHAGAVPAPAAAVPVAPVVPALPVPAAQLSPPTLAEPAAAPVVPVAEPESVPEVSRPAARPALARRAPPTPPLQPPPSLAVSARPEAPAPAPAEPVVRVSPGPLSPTPTRQDVVSALEPLRGEVQQCAGNLRGIAQLDVTVASNGSVTHAVVAGDFAGTPEGSCIARIARSAKFAPFERPRFRVIYPYAL